MKMSRDQRLTYLFVHFNVQPIGHLIVLERKKKETEKKYSFFFIPLSICEDHQIFSQHIREVQGAWVFL